MRKLFFAVGFGLLAMGGIAQEKKEVFAAPDQQNGYYIFFKSKPAGNYEFLGSEKIGVVLLSSDECEKKIFKKVAENYPAANGLIFTGLNYCECEAVKIEN